MMLQYCSHHHSDYDYQKGGARKKLMAAAAAVTPEEWKKAEEAKCLRWGKHTKLVGKGGGGPHESTLKQLGYSNVNNVCVIFSADKSRHKSAVKRAEAARLMARW